MPAGPLISRHEMPASNATAAVWSFSIRAAAREVRATACSGPGGNAVISLRAAAGSSLAKAASDPVR